MPKPRRRIGAKLVAVSEYAPSPAHASHIPPLFPSVATHQPQASHVLERPEAGIVLTIACGSRAGEMVGIEDHEIMIGFSHDCLLRFRHDQYPLVSGKLLLRRGTEGWYALRVSGNSAFINQRQLKDKCPLRSGDIIRLSSRGPDVQFTMQSGGLDIRALVERYLPPQPSTAPQPVAQAADAEQPGAKAPAAQSPLPQSGGAASGISCAAAEISCAAAGITAVDATAAVDAADAEPTTPSQAAASLVVRWSDWLWKPQSMRRAIVLLVIILVLIVALAFAMAE